MEHVMKRQRFVKTTAAIYKKRLRCIPQEFATYTKSNRSMQSHTEWQLTKSINYEISIVV